MAPANVRISFMNALIVGGMAAIVILVAKLAVEKLPVPDPAKNVVRSI